LEFGAIGEANTSRFIFVVHKRLPCKN
jgi:hypothetical protein